MLVDFLLTEIKFLDIIESIRKEVKVLKKSFVNIIIAVGHAGINVDKQIAEEIPEVDVVVGGHTDTLMYNGKNFLFLFNNNGSRIS